MKKKLAILLPVCALLMVLALAAGGGADDPLASLSYLTGTFTQQVEQEVEERLDKSDREILTKAENGESVVESALVWAEKRLKRGDMLLGSTGTNVLILAGEVQVSFPSGAVVDVTTGEEVSSGSALKANHRYMVAEDTSATFIVTGKTAVVDYQGPYSFYTSDAVDYNAMAAALKQLHLFKGSFTGYGEGFDLEVAPTRLQALIMFIRVLGEEEAALAWTEGTHFSDIAKGTQAEKYVGYAYAKGYTNGYSKTEFRPGNPVNAYQYTEFVLRAMGYSSAANTNLADTLIRAEAAGLLTFGEASLLQVEQFLRADLVYISYYALDTALPDGVQTLRSVLMDKGIFTQQEWQSARALVRSQRM